MPVVPLIKPEGQSASVEGQQHSESARWVGLAAGGALVAGALLMMTGKRRAGMVAAASGTALAMLGEQETLKKWWSSLPGYIEDVQEVLDEVQGTVDGVAAKRETLGRILGR